MEIDEEKIDDTVLALLQLTLCGDDRAWKGQDWTVMERLHEKGYLFDPKGKAKSVALTEEGMKRSAELFERMFGK